MKPQTAAFLEKATVLLADAETMLSVELNDAAGRTAYLAGFHAAQALIFETHGRVYKTHTGVRAEFARLSKDYGELDLEIRSFLGFAYKLKAIADYESGPGSKVSAASAAAALRTARRYVELLTNLISRQGPTTST